MKRWWRGWVLGVVAWLLFLVARAPADRLLPLAQSRLPQVHLAGIEGTLWSGRAALVDVRPLQFSEVRWDLRLLPLLTGRLEFAVDGQLQGRPVHANAGSTLLGRPYLRQVRGRVAASDLTYWLGLSQVGLGGELDFDLDEVRWFDTGLPAVAGHAGWMPALVEAPLELNLGQVKLDTRIEQQVTKGKLDASGGALVAQADVELKPDGAYRIDANIRQKGEIPPAVGKFLSSFAEYRDGVYRLEWSDTL
ncbi:MAG TPA: type II secretion system protein N [Gammaproteobacteria bacterium]|nr:type II secretion system protein N [Gammaproteobacteria bacterium]